MSAKVTESSPSIDGSLLAVASELDCDPTMDIVSARLRELRECEAKWKKHVASLRLRVDLEQRLLRLALDAAEGHDIDRACECVRMYLALAGAVV